MTGPDTRDNYVIAAVTARASRKTRSSLSVPWSRGGGALTTGAPPNTNRSATPRRQQQQQQQQSVSRCFDSRLLPVRHCGRSVQFSRVVHLSLPHTRRSVFVRFIFFSRFLAPSRRRRRRRLSSSPLSEQSNIVIAINHNRVVHVVHEPQAEPILAIETKRAAHAQTSDQVKTIIICIIFFT